MKRDPRRVPAYREGPALDAAVRTVAEFTHRCGPVRIRNLSPAEVKLLPSWGGPKTKAAAAAEARQWEHWYRSGCKSAWDPERVREATV